MTPYGLPKETLDNWKFPTHVSLWERLKIRLLGKKIVEIDGQWKSTWYIYKDTLYLADLRSIFQ